MIKKRLKKKLWTLDYYLRPNTWMRIQNKKQNKEEGELLTKKYLKCEKKNFQTSRNLRFPN